MVFHILCPECGDDLSEISNAYKACRAEFVKSELSKKAKIDVDKVVFKPNSLTSSEFILKALGINRMCCRIHCMGATTFDIDI